MVNALLEATARVLVRDGFERASTNRIADRAGVSVGSLYQYFPNREALVAALVDRHVEKMNAIIAAAFERIQTLPLRAATRAMVDTILEVHLKVDPGLHKVLAEEVPRVGALNRMEDVQLRAHDLALSYLEAHRGEIRPRNLSLAALLAVEIFEALTHQAVLSRPELLENDQFAIEVTDLVVRYLET